MNEKNSYNVIYFSIFIYFTIQSITKLLESIYMIDLLNTSLDANVLGLIFFFSTILLLFIKPDEKILKISGTGLLISRLLFPLFKTQTMLLLSGIAVAFAFVFYPTLLILGKNISHSFSIGFGLAVLYSVLFRTLGSTLDITTNGYTQLIALIMAIIACYLLFNTTNDKLTDPIKSNTEKPTNIFISITGIFSIIVLYYFAYFTPNVFVRWSELNYIITIFLSVLSISIYLIYRIYRPVKIGKNYLILLNLLLIITLIAVIILNQVDFLTDPAKSPIIVSSTNIIIKLIMYVNIILSPIMLLDLEILIYNINHDNKNKLIISFLINEFILILLMFMFVFTNVWGYVDPISNLFRGLFWLPFLIPGIILNTTLFQIHTSLKTSYGKGNKKIITMIITIIFIVSALSPIIVPIRHENVNAPSSLKIMTYNIQQGVDAFGEKNYENQLNKIKEINPDIIGLEESDTPKISTGNSDIVKYFADKLGYYSYYGPKTVMQTYGVAILSRFPIVDSYSFYTIGDQDEIGSLFAKIKINNQYFNVFVNHPCCNDASFMDHTQALLDLSDGLNNTILMGDFNWREDTVFYSMITDKYIDTWRAVWPAGIDKDGLNMSQTIDHIFVSKNFTVINSVYIPSPQSETDHPLLWSEVKLNI